MKTSSQIRTLIFRLIDTGIVNPKLLVEIKEMLKYKRVITFFDKNIEFNAVTKRYKFKSLTTEQVMRGENTVNKLFDLYTVESLKAAPQNQKRLKKA